MQFSEKLTELRRRRGLSQEQLADFLGVTRQSVSKWESGSVMPELGKLIALSDLFHVTVDALVKDRLDLPDTGTQPVREFSGGMKRRLALARALLAPFDVLLLDEPFTGLDQENRARALAAIREAAGDRPVLLVTHDIADAEGAPVVRL